MNPQLLALFARYGIQPLEANREALRAAVAKEAAGVREVSIAPRTVNREARTLDATIATEEPVEVWDWERWEPVDEVLLMAGCRLKQVRKHKLPLLDCHQRNSARNVLGSVVNLRIEGPSLVGTEVFSALSEPEFVKTTEGHLDQRSVGYRIYATTYIKPGETAKVGDREFAAKANRGLSVVTDWAPLEDSVVPLGADPASGTRAAADTPPAPPAPVPVQIVLNPAATPANPPARKDPTRPMNPKLRALLVSLGMPADATDEAAGEFLMRADIQEKIAARNAPPPPPPPAPAVQSSATDPSAVSRAEFEALRAQIAASQRAEQVEAVFRSFLHLDGVDALRAKAIQDGVSVDQARGLLVDHLARQTPSAGRAVVTKDEHEKIRECAVQAVFQRANPQAKVSDEERKQAAQYRGMSLMDLARFCLDREGQATRGMDKMTLAGRAFTSSSDYTHILGTSANKALLAAYAMAPQQWQRWCKRGTLSDFKATPRVQMSDVGLLSKVDEGAEFPQGAVTDTAENIQLATYGKIFAITRQAIINDDLDAFGRIPAYHANAWARTINQLAVTIPLANGTMHDTGALYNATAVTTAGGHANLDTSTTTITTQATAEAVIRALRTLIMAQKDADGESYLQLQPRLILTGHTLAVYYVQALYELARGQSEARVDIRRMGLDVIEDPEVENSSLTGYGVNTTYMFCDPVVAPAVEVAFLEGNDAPTLEQQTGFEIDGVKYKVRGDAGAKAIDWRPTAKHVL